MSKDIDPPLSVLLYVYIGSGLPIKFVGSNFGDEDSSNVKLYGGNHIILPPFGPLSQAGKSCTVNPGLFDVLQAKFSNESIYFLTWPLIIFDDCPFLSLNGTILRLYVLSNTE